MKNMFGTLKHLAELDLTLLTTFKKVWLDPANGSDGHSGEDLANAVDTLSTAYGKITDGDNQAIMLVGDGTTAATARVDAAFTWAKSESNLIGVCAPTLFSQRARLAPTSSTTAFANFFTVSGSGNLFQNIQFYHGFTSDGNNQIALTVTGSRNVFKNCHIAGGTKGSDAGARSLKITGGEENLFEDCVIGLDTIDRSAANASISFASAASRNVFRRCIFPIRATATTPLLAITAAVGAMDKFNVFEDCVVWNHGTSTIAGLCTLNASSGGYLVFIRPSVIRSITGFGTDATSRAQIFVTGPTDGSTVSGIGYNPNA